MKVDLYINGDLLDPIDKKLVSQLPFKDKMVVILIAVIRIIITRNFDQVLTAKLYQLNSNMACSPDSSSDSSTGSPHNPYIGPNPEAEGCLPGVVIKIVFVFIFLQKLFSFCR